MRKDLTMAANRSGAPDVRTTPRSINTAVDRALVEESHAHGIRVSHASERSKGEPLARGRAAQWLEENRAALDSSNAYVEAHGLPLAKYRLF
jgi:antitoxin CcdA